MSIGTKHQDQGIFWNVFFFKHPWMEILHHYSDELTLVQILYTNLYIVPLLCFQYRKGDDIQIRNTNLYIVPFPILKL